MGYTSKLLVFELDSRRYAVDIKCVEQVVRIVDVDLLPEMPRYISGLINYHGDIIPVVDLDFLFNRTSREICLTDQLIIIKTSSLKCALKVDTTIGIVNIDEADYKETEEIIDGIPYLKGIVKDNAGMILISDSEKFFKPEELRKINDLLVEKKEYLIVNS